MGCTNPNPHPNPDPDPGPNPHLAEVKQREDPGLGLHGGVEASLAHVCDQPIVEHTRQVEDAFDLELIEPRPAHAMSACRRERG